jgi:hypothetical protein
MGEAAARFSITCLAVSMDLSPRENYATSGKTASSKTGGRVWITVSQMRLVE